ncbi:MAG: family 16 glycoside hydrolase [Myxococcota bacterium]
MKRRLALVAALLVALVALPWAGFRLWLSGQPEETRIAVEAFTAREFLAVVLDHFFPQPIDDFGRFDRRDHPGRGASPWVMRSSLDGRPRMLSVALAPELWLAYSTETASIHQLWRGDVDFSGPAFDARHGREPMSRGAAWWRPDATTAWRVRDGGEWRPAAIRWRGHGFDRGTGALWLHYEVRDPAGRSREVVERPERATPADGDPTKDPGGSSVGLVRVFEVAAGEGPELALELAAPSVAGASVETEAVLEAGSRLRLAPGRTELVQRFAGEPEPIARPDVAALPESAFSAYDCETCHGERERIVGPAWQEIAARHAGANRAATAAMLATRIREGGVGHWGSVAMPPHPDLSHDEATALALRVLETELESDSETALETKSGNGAADEPASAADTTYAYDTGPRPATLHPALRATTIAPPGFTPRVGGLAFLPDGRLAVSTWDHDGAVFLVAGWDGPAESVRVRRIAEGLHEPLGLAFADGALHVIQKQEITRLVDADGDDWIDEYRTLANDWTATSNFHEFGFGLPVIDGFLYAGLSVCILEGGKSCRDQTADRGRIVRVSLETGAVERIASGLRTPNGVAATPTGELLVTDNQGAWLPSSKLIRVERGADYGWRPPGESPDPAAVTPPTLWLPQNEVGNSPTQPLVPTAGPYAGQVLFGDVFNGGLKRAVLEEVAGVWQGVAFHFSGGLAAPVNRLVEAPDGSLIAGEIGSPGNWGEYGKPWYGLERLVFADEPAFEPMRIALRPGGFDVVYSRALAPGLALDLKAFRLEDWFYVPTPRYGGPKHAVRALPVDAVRLSADRRVVSLDVPGLAAGRVVHLRLDPAIRSERGEPAWVDEAWYTLNALASGEGGEGESPAAGTSAEIEATAASAASAVGAPAPGAPTAGSLTPSELAEGWEPLFDGRSFAGWKNYGATTDRVEGWAIRDGALEFTRNEPFALLVLRHMNPFARPSLDLMTKERFGDFELRLEWKVEPGGNSGIFYLVPDERDRLGWTRALEMQVLDDERHADGQKEKRRAGDLYDVVASVRRMSRPAGEWNEARIRVERGRIQHWLNGEKVVDVVRGSPDWDRAIAASKHAGVEGFGLAREGHILLQDHGDAVWYRNIAIRRLPSE